MDPSGSFDCQEHADVLLKFIVVGPEAGESDGYSASSPSFSKSFFVHAVVLLNSDSSDDNYFRVLLRNRWSATPLFGTANECIGTHQPLEASAEGELNGRGLPLCVLKEIFDTKAQAQAAELALRTIYGHRVPCSSHPLLLLQALQIAIGWDATSCADALADELARSSLDDVSMEFLQLLYGDLPHDLRESSVMKKVLPLGAAGLVSRFGIVGDVQPWPPVQPLPQPQPRAETQQAPDTSPVSPPQSQIDARSELMQFCSLPVAAVVVWAASDGLTVASENEVVQLLQSWYCSAQRSPGEGFELAACLHVCDITPAYRTWVMPKLEWMPPALARLLPLVAQARPGLVLACHQQIPKPWMTPRYHTWDGPSGLDSPCSMPPDSPLGSRGSSPDRHYYRNRSPGFQYNRNRSPDHHYHRSRSPNRRYDRSRSPNRRYDRNRSPDRRYDRSRSRSLDRLYNHRSRRSGHGRSPSPSAQPHTPLRDLIWAIRGDDLELLCSGEV